MIRFQSKFLFLFRAGSLRYTTVALLTASLQLSGFSGFFRRFQLLLFPLPVPGDHCRDFKEDIERYRHRDLSDHIRWSQNSGDHQNDDKDQLAVLGQRGVIYQTDLDEQQQEDRQFKADAHSQHEFRYKTDIRIGCPLERSKAHLIREPDRRSQGDRQHQIVTESKSHQEETYAQQERLTDIAQLIHLQCRQNKLRDKE